MARAAGYSTGSALFVTTADPNDWIDLAERVRSTAGHTCETLCRAICRGW